MEFITKDAAGGLLIYFAAHAPEAPPWFVENWEATSLPRKNDKTGMMVEWRYQYAKRMAERFKHELRTEA